MSSPMLPIRLSGAARDAMTAVIEVSDLAKRYGATVAVDGVSFSVDEGEIFGFLGPNGAGKTTTVECIVGLRRADAGTIRVYGLDPLKDRAPLHELVGVQRQESALQTKVTVAEALAPYASSWQRRTGRCRVYRKHQGSRG